MAGGTGGDSQERVREHGQGDVPVPGAVPADLIVIQACLVVRLAGTVLDAPPGPGYRDQPGQRDRAR